MARRMRVRELREHKGWSQEDLAAASKVPRSTISEVERGERDSRNDTLSAIATALGVTIDALFMPEEHLPPRPVVSYTDAELPALARALLPDFQDLDRALSPEQVETIRAILSEQVKMLRRLSQEGKLPPSRYVPPQRD